MVETDSNSLLHNDSRTHITFPQPDIGSRIVHVKVLQFSDTGMHCTFISKTNQNTKVFVFKVYNYLYHLMICKIHTLTSIQETSVKQCMSHTDCNKVLNHALHCLGTQLHFLNVMCVKFYWNLMMGLGWCIYWQMWVC